MGGCALGRRGCQFEDDRWKRKSDKPEVPSLGRYVGTSAISAVRFVRVFVVIPSAVRSADAALVMVLGRIESAESHAFCCQVIRAYLQYLATVLSIL